MNTLVVRKVFRTLKDSCFTELKWAIHRLGVDAFWDVKESPLEMTYTPTGQKIYFRGLDDPLKVTSITVEHGYLCWMWIEEAYEITNEADFDMTENAGKPGAKADLMHYQRKVIRHELTHALLFESGLSNDSSWAENEEVVDWIAIQFPKMIKAFEEVDCI